MDPKKIKYKYKFKDDYNPIYVNGAYGGISSNGEIIINFYLERMALPETQEFELGEDNKLSQDPIFFEPEDLGKTFIRYVSQGVVLRVDRAESIHAWLGNLLEKLKKSE